MGIYVGDKRYAPYIGDNRRRYMGGGGDVDYSKQYLTFEALEDGTFKHNSDALEYSLDGGSTWVSLAANTDTPTISAGNTILWRGNMSVGGNTRYFVSTESHFAWKRPWSGSRTTGLLSPFMTLTGINWT